jgi:hypothetical protein
MSARVLFACWPRRHSLRVLRDARGWLVETILDQRVDWSTPCA